jgi:hypothetical protein
MTQPIMVDPDEVASLINQTRASVRDLEDISTQASMWAEDDRVGDLESIASEAAESADQVVTELRRIQRAASTNPAA